jgi:hypothetical protein
MPKPTARRATHPKGELEPTLGAPVEHTKLDTFGGRVEVLWDPKAEVTALGPLVYFIQFLKASGLWERWVEECPIAYSSNNAPPKAGILGGILITLLSGHRRFAHIELEPHFRAALNRTLVLDIDATVKTLLGIPLQAEHDSGLKANRIPV